MRRFGWTTFIPVNFDKSPAIWLGQIRIEMLDHDKSQTGIGGHLLEEFFQRLDAAGRGADADNTRTFEVWSSIRVFESICRDGGVSSTFSNVRKLDK